MNGVIYLHRISDIRVGAASRKNFDLVIKLCGEARLAHVAIVTTMWDEVEKKVAIARETQLKGDDLLFKGAIAKGAKMFRHDNTVGTATTVIAYLVKKRKTTLQIQEELVDRQAELTQTTVGRLLQSDIDTLIVRHEEELRELKTEMVSAIEAKDVTSRQELEQTREELEQKLRTLRGDKDVQSPEVAQGKASGVQLMPQLAEEGNYADFDRLVDRRRVPASPSSRPFSMVEQSRSTVVRPNRPHSMAVASPRPQSMVAHTALPVPTVQSPSPPRPTPAQPSQPAPKPKKDRQYEGGDKMPKACCIIF